MPRDPVRLVVVDASWAQRFEACRDELLGAFGTDEGGNERAPFSEVHHVGSTAVPGLWAKPTLDVLAVAAVWPLTPEVLATLTGPLGYVDRGEHGLPGRQYFTRAGHEIHLHVVDPAAGHRDRHLAFRDLLRSRDAARRRYASRKRELVERFSGDREAYVRGKASLVRALEAEALSASEPARTEGTSTEGTSMDTARQDRADAAISRRPDRSGEC